MRTFKIITNELLPYILPMGQIVSITDNNEYCLVGKDPANTIVITNELSRARIIVAMVDHPEWFERMDTVTYTEEEMREFGAMAINRHRTTSKSTLPIRAFDNCISGWLRDFNYTHKK